MNRKHITVIVILATLIAVMLPFFLLPNLGIGGMPPTYPASDYDAALTRAAQAFEPVLRALRRFQYCNKRWPSSLAELPGMNNQTSDWYYFPQNGNFVLSQKLGWDPVLTYSSEDGTWTFCPGDGSPDKKIKLRVTTK